MVSLLKKKTLKKQNINKGQEWRLKVPKTKKYQSPELVYFKVQKKLPQANSQPQKPT